MDLHPDYPVVEDRYQMTTEWSVVLPGKFNRRLEEGDLVLWRAGLAVWVAVWGNDNNETVQERLAWMKSERSTEAYEIEERQNDSVLYYSYRLDEYGEDERTSALYCYAIADSGHVQMAVYFDEDSEMGVAEQICAGLRYEPGEL